MQNFFQKVCLRPRAEMEARLQAFNADPWLEALLYPTFLAQADLPMSALRLALLVRTAILQTLATLPLTEDAPVIPTLHATIEALCPEGDVATLAKTLLH